MVAKKTTAVKAKRSPDKTNEVNDFMAKLDHPLKPEIEAVRAIILGADKRIKESIKWNAPSFFVQEYFATFKLHPRETIQVVFHTGAKLKANAAEVKINDPSSMMKWISKDRGMVTFSDMKEIKSKKVAFAAIVKQWVKQM